MIAHVEQLLGSQHMTLLMIRRWWGHLIQYVVLLYISLFCHPLSHTNSSTSVNGSIAVSTVPQPVCPMTVAHVVMPLYTRLSQYLLERIMEEMCRLPALVGCLSIAMALTTILHRSVVHWSTACLGSVGIHLFVLVCCSNADRVQILFSHACIDTCIQALGCTLVVCVYSSQQHKNS
jgi:hypothetical protein